MCCCLARAPKSDLWPDAPYPTVGYFSIFAESDESESCSPLGVCPVVAYKLGSTLW